MKRIGAVFPHDDPISQLMFRLAVLRDDLQLEIQLALPEKLPEVDRGDPLLRRMYAMRKHFHTLHTARDVFQENGKLIHELIERREESELMANLAEALSEARTILNRNFDDLAAWRNSLSAHLSRERTEWILEHHAHRIGEMQLGLRKGDVFYRLPTKALMLGALPDDRSIDESETLKEIGARVAAIIASVLEAVDHAIAYWLRLRHQWA